jgi:hypothetical protein
MAQDRTEKLKGQITRIEKEFSEVMMTNYIFMEVRTIINDNERLYSEGNHFLDYMTLSFVHSLVVAVRRQLDTSKGVASLHKLLRELERPPSIIKREYFLKSWKHTFQDIERTLEPGVRTFNELVGHDKTCLERKQIQADINLLKTESQLIIDYANHHIAHYSDSPPLPVCPKLADLSESIECIHKLICKYYTLLTGTILGGEFSPTFLYNWKSIFTHPWIVPTTNRP